VKVSGARYRVRTCDPYRVKAKRTLGYFRAPSITTPYSSMHTHANMKSVTVKCDSAGRMTALNRTRNNWRKLSCSRGICGSLRRGHAISNSGRPSRVSTMFTGIAVLFARVHPWKILRNERRNPSSAANDQRLVVEQAAERAFLINLPPWIEDGAPLASSARSI
jgi:hypothetical protein